MYARTIAAQTECYTDEQIGSNYRYRSANWDPDIDSFFPLSVHCQTDTIQIAEYIEIPSFTCPSLQFGDKTQTALEDVCHPTNC